MLAAHVQRGENRTCQKNQHGERNQDPHALRSGEERLVTCEGNDSPGNGSDPFVDQLYVCQYTVPRVAVALPRERSDWGSPLVRG